MLSAAVSTGADALARAYGYDSPAQFVIGHIAALRSADNPLAQRCGELLFTTIDGFKIGADSSLMLLQVGRAMLGVVDATPVAVQYSNPITLTCAAIGAIHYGWSALSDAERAAILSSVALAFEAGVELVRAIVNYAIRFLAEAPGLLAGAAGYIGEMATAAGRTVYSVSAAVGGGINDVWSTTSRWAGGTIGGLSWPALPFGGRAAVSADGATATPDDLPGAGT